LTVNATSAPGTGGPQLSGTSKTTDLLQIFDGIENDDDDNFLCDTPPCGLFAPPDTVGDVGISHYVQMTNIVMIIFDKSGSAVLGPFASNVFWTDLGGACEDTNRGDPVVLYDEETDRWLVSQFGFAKRLSARVGIYSWDLVLCRDCDAVLNNDRPERARCT